MNRVSIIGSGNVASWFTFALNRANVGIAQIYSRNITDAQRLAATCSAQAVDSLSALSPADVFIFAVTDDALPELVARMPFKMGLAVHCAGSVTQNIFSGYAENYGVIYPCQTISKHADFDKQTVPLCVEGNTHETETTLVGFARQMSDSVSVISESQRLALHLAAVFASNFSNALYNIAFDILQKENVDWQLIMPLLENTLAKLKTMRPVDAQTGPARRKDTKTLNRHYAALKNDETLSQIYRLLSDYISENMTE